MQRTPRTSSAVASADASAHRVLVLGEALIDVVLDPSGGTREHVGGSPLNVALGVSRLGHAVDFATAIGDDERGDRVCDLLDTGGVTLVEGSRTREPTSTAIARIDAARAATYEFELHLGVPGRTVTSGTVHAHTGSIGAVLEPGASGIRATLATVRQHGTTSYDPNIRPSIMGGAQQVRPLVEDLVALADLVKASSDDLDFLYPGESAQGVMARWCASGAGLAVVTLGADGVTYRTRREDRSLTLPPEDSQVVDTVGAGDSFMAGLISGLLDLGLLGEPGARTRLRESTLEQVRPAIERGLATSAVTVGRAGAYAPTRDEL